MKIGLTERDIFHLDKDRPGKPLIKDTFQGRLQYGGKYPNVDILITNLVLDDSKSRDWSFLVVSFFLITDECNKSPECPEPYQVKFLVALIIPVAVLSCISAGFILRLIFKVTALVPVSCVDVIELFFHRL